jgi:hypothetical protein
MSERLLASSVAPELVVTIDGAVQKLSAADIVVTDPWVSWDHAVPRSAGSEAVRRLALGREKR